MEVILVDKSDNQIGKEDKLKAHREGRLHRAFSVFIFDSKKRLLLQKRADLKYHSPGLWTNTCCSHPIRKEIREEAEKRLKKEMGIECKLEEKFSFFYKADVGNGLIENEYDHVFFGNSDKTPKPDPKEVSDWKWMPVDELKRDIKENPGKYTAWLKICIKKILKEVKSSS